MAQAPSDQLLPSLATRDDYLAFLDEWTVGTVDQLAAHKSTRGLVKAHLVETSRHLIDPILAFEGLGNRIRAVDESTILLTQEGEDAPWALVDVSFARYPILLTMLDATISNARARDLVGSGPNLDHCWIHAQLFQTLWQNVVESIPTYRFSQLVFEHESVFEASIQDELTFGLDELEEYERTESRRARLEFTERIGRLDEALKLMRTAYAPLYSIVKLRYPAEGRGGYDIYFDGRMTNRGDYVRPFISTADSIRRIYSSIIDYAERFAWHGDDGAARPFGEPVTFKFSEPLPDSTFENIITSLSRKNNRFRIWGRPLRRGPSKVHMYAVDHHLWQPIDVELTKEYMTLVIPERTCGNSVQRIFLSLHRFVDPRVKLYIGGRSLDSEWMGKLAAAR